VTEFKARPTVYKGIQMRSRLEAGFAAWLDMIGDVEWAYEPAAYGDESGQYLPDFLLLNVLIQQHHPRRPERKVFVEVKPKRQDDELLLSLARILWSSEPQAFLLTVWPEGSTWGLRLICPPTSPDGEGRPMDVVWNMELPCLDADGTRFHDKVVHTVLVPLPTPWHDGYWKPRPVPSTQGEPQEESPQPPEPQQRKPFSMERTMGRMAALYKANRGEASAYDEALTQVKDEAPLNVLLLIAVEIGTRMAEIEANIDPTTGKDPQGWPSAAQYLADMIEDGKEAERQVPE